LVGKKWWVVFRGSTRASEEKPGVTPRASRYYGAKEVSYMLAMLLKIVTVFVTVRLKLTYRKAR
jgi:hypothetical protein